ncbi:SMI1/KNR4 family protein [Pedobacter ghigonis]|uniref:SMI1/KNR4 family protein n=1 Tax=Pedobacter ghigonis TaxID=2730403 RepID=UPI00158A1105|nr:SMI1/KNR4 family protein [Pedobacter ghigonis]
MIPTIKDIIARIKTNKQKLGITLLTAASLAEISDFETIMGVKLPDEFIQFYNFSNGLESEEDMFRIIPLNEIIENIQHPDTSTVNPNDFHFAEYLIYSDMWTININSEERNKYGIYNKAENVITLTDSLPHFLDVFLTGGVFDGLYKWRENLEQLPG